MSAESAPSYAILSHTWGPPNEEVSFQEIKLKDRSKEIRRRYGFQKIEMTCEIALKEHRLQYAWVDTCCIDKSSSAELSEAINSMFKWYQQAAVCFAWLVDWVGDEARLGSCKWFTRGWTLQELIAPPIVHFYDMSWVKRGTKLTLVNTISKICKISMLVLKGDEELSGIPVATRLSWAAERKTTREEDIAYCLMGIFEVNMPMLYGEGRRAFSRLQEQIMAENPDTTIFAWKGSQTEFDDHTGLLAPSPSTFKDVPKYLHSIPELGFSISNRGVRLKAPTYVRREQGQLGFLPICYAMMLSDQYGDRYWDESMYWDGVRHWATIGVYIRDTGNSQLVRARSGFLGECPWEKSIKELSKFSIPKSISVQQSKLINLRLLRVRMVSDLGSEVRAFNQIDLSVSDKPDFKNELKDTAWSPIESAVFFPSTKGHIKRYYVKFHFESVEKGKYPSFAIICGCQARSIYFMNKPDKYIWFYGLTRLYPDFDSLRVERIKIVRHSNHLNLYHLTTSTRPWSEII